MHVRGGGYRNHAGATRHRDRLTRASSLTAARERFLLKLKRSVWAAAAEAGALASSSEALQALRQ
jgi:hypothetical protein